jgi:hypothetical protein
MPRPAFVLAMASALVLGFALPASADFLYVRSIPAPNVPCFLDYVTGLDRTESALLVTSRYQASDQSSGASYVSLIDPSTGDVLRQEAFPGAPLACSRPYWQLASCAYERAPGGAFGVEGSYWAGDPCGEIAGFQWDGGIDVSEVFTLAGAPRPVSMVASGDTLFVLDDENGWIIARYWMNGQCYTDTIDLDGGPEAPAAVATWQDHLLVSGASQQRLARSHLGWDYTLWEFTRGGDLVATHVLQSPRPCTPKNITVYGNQLYVASTSDSILVFEPVGLGIEVPGGDSIVVEAVPDGIEVVFDSVSSPGQLFCDVLDSDSCPPPDGVTFFSTFYDLSTTAQFDYAAQVIVSTDEPLPEGIDLRNLRIFARPSGHCRDYRDITTVPAEAVDGARSLRTYTRTKSEDDEFSVFTLGDDRRPPMDVVELKFEILEGAIDAGEDSIPGGVLVAIRRLFNDAREDYYRGSSGLAASRADSIATLVRATPAIPHTYDSLVPGRNLAGRLISDAHTLSFSLRFSESEAVETSAVIEPEHFSQSRDGWIRAYLEVPEEFLGEPEVDSQHIFLKHRVQAVPESVGVGDYLDNDGTQVKAVFSAAEVAAVAKRVGSTGVRITCFIDGYEVYADGEVFGLNAVPMMMAEGPVLAGSTQRVTWEDSPCGRAAAASLWYSSDGGAAWALVKDGIANAYYDWSVPLVETDRGVLKVTCATVDGSPIAVTSSEFAVTSSAGVGYGGGDGKPTLNVRPNPSASSFAVELVSIGDRPVEVHVYSVEGQLVKTLFAGRGSTGTLALSWDGDSDNGSRVSAGAYFVIARLGGTTITRKLVLQR